MRIFSILLFVSFIACQPAKKDEVDLKALKDEVFEIHDEVMPKMGDLRRVRKSLMLQADSIQSSDSLRAAQLIDASDKLDAANESMMVWMRNFNPEFDGSDEEILNYLNDQKESISQVRTDMLETLAAGEELIGGDQ